LGWFGVWGLGVGFGAPRSTCLPVMAALGAVCRATRKRRTNPAELGSSSIPQSIFWNFKGGSHFSGTGPDALHLTGYLQAMRGLVQMVTCAAGWLSSSHSRCSGESHFASGSLPSPHSRSPRSATATGPVSFLVVVSSRIARYCRGGAFLWMRSSHGFYFRSPLNRMAMAADMAAAASLDRPRGRSGPQWRFCST